MNPTRAEDLEQDPVVRDLREVLREAAGKMYGWQIAIAVRRSDQRLLEAGPDNSLSVGTLRENVREKTINLTLYVRHGEPLSMGMASLTIDPLRPLAGQVAEGLSAARTNFNPVWDLVAPSSEPFRSVRTVDERLLADPVRITEELAAQADAQCRGLAGVKVNYAELFVNTNLRLTLFSTGLCLPQAGSDLYFEVAMEKLPLPNTQEVHNYRKSIDAEGLDLSGFLRETAEETGSLGRAHMPATDDQATVLLRAPEINRILHALVDQCDASREYNRLPHLKPGDALIRDGAEPEHDSLEIRLDPFIDLMAETAAFSFEGLPARGGLLIEAGRVHARRVSRRMGTYLGLEPVPLCGNLVLPPGRLSVDELRHGADRVLEILSFSSLLVNTDHLTWSSEIKLGRLWERTAEGWKGRLLKGGIVSGNIRENLKSCLWSRETARHNNTADIFSAPEGYVGPAAWLIKSGVTVSGE